MNEIREERVAGIEKARTGPVIKPGTTEEGPERETRDCRRGQAKKRNNALGYEREREKERS